MVNYILCLINKILYSIDTDSNIGVSLITLLLNLLLIKCWSSSLFISSLMLLCNSNETIKLLGFRNMSNDSVVMDPVEMQPFIHSRKGIPANTLLVR